MKCKNCGHDNLMGTIFCKKCGERLEKSEYKKSNNPEILTYPKTEEEQGCLTKAWYSIKSSDHWFKKLILVALCNVVPIVEFASTGYSLNWGVDAAKGKSNELPKEIIQNQNFKTGFFEWITWLAYGFIFLIISTIISGTFGKIWLIGTIISIAVIVAKYFYDTFVSLANIKMAVDNKLSSSFEIKKIWNSYKKDFTGLLCSFFVPSIICSLIAIAFCLIIFAIFAWNDLVYLFSFVSQIDSTFASPSSTMYFIQVISTVAVCLILCYIAISFMTGIEKIIRYKAIGEYINKHSEEWIK